jgi:arylformamidase
MINAHVFIGEKKFSVDFNSPVDISIPIRREKNVKAFHLPDPIITVAEGGDFVGDVRKGGSCNVEDITFSPHGNTTHTECVGHISVERIYLSKCLKNYIFKALLIDLPLPFTTNYAITAEDIKDALPLDLGQVEALIIRTIPNSEEKLSHDYSSTDPACFSPEAMEEIKALGIQHLLVDLPSLDKEIDKELPAHHIFFGYPDAIQRNNTVTELVFVPDEVKTGYYLLNLQVLNIEMDASPSHPVLYELIEI